MKLILNLKRILILGFFLGAMVNSYSIFGQCPQENLKVESIELRDIYGKLFDVNDNYAIGDLVTGQIWVTINGNTTSAHTFFLTYDVFVNGVSNQVDVQSCLFEAKSVELLTPQFATILTWKWGDIVQLKDIFMYWNTGNNPDNGVCTPPDKNVNAQCYFNEPGIEAALPLVPNFIYQSGQCNTTVQFTNETIGGSPPFNYSYIWDFDGLGTSISSNPIFNFPSSGTYTISLTANDGTTTTTIYKDIFIDPNFGIQVEIFPTKINDESGIIYVQSVTGGTPPYTYLWTGPNEFTSTDKDIFNLADGLYQLTVTDSKGCQQTEQYIMDIASVLNLTWKSFDLDSHNGKIKISWEMSSEATGVTYDVQRSLGNITDFEKVATVLGQKSISGHSFYEFEDLLLPQTHERIYYRISRKMQGQNDFSPVKMIELPHLIERDSWLVYPNPTSGGFFNINFRDLTESEESMVTMDLFDTGNFFRKESIQITSGQTIRLQDVFGTLPNGILILRIQDGKQVKVFKLINQN